MHLLYKDGVCDVIQYLIEREKITFIEGVYIMNSLEKKYEENEVTDTIKEAFSKVPEDFIKHPDKVLKIPADGYNMGPRSDFDLNPINTTAGNPLKHRTTTTSP